MIRARFGSLAWLVAANSQDLFRWAAETAESSVAPLGRRWFHVQAVAEKARVVARVFDSDAGELLVASAYLHDVGYAADLAVTGFHPLDGGLRSVPLGYERMAQLVAHHSGARLEAVLRGITGYEDEFPFV